MASAMDEIKTIIAKSGNSFHCRVLNSLKSCGWSILVSPYYNDISTNKPREIDLIAEKAFQITDFAGRFSGTINIRLYIECKYIPNKTIFWFHGKDINRANKLIEATTPCRLDNIYTKEHHYMESTKNVAKLFADDKSKGAENEVFFKALNQSLNSTIYYRNKSSIITNEKYPKILKTLHYPVIICNSFENLFGVMMDTEDDPYSLESNFVMEVNYAHPTSTGSGMDEYFLLDVVDFTQMDEFLAVVEKDAGIAGSFAVR